MDSNEAEDWSGNYFNYFTEIEEHFQRARGTHLFLLSPLDWALIESWKNAQVPVEAVLEGISNAFEKWKSRKVKRRSVNSLAYCAQAVAEAAQRTPGRPMATAAPPFASDEILEYLRKGAAQVGVRSEAPFVEIVSALEFLIGQLPASLEDLERHLSALEEKMVAAARGLASEEELYKIRESLDRELKPYRGKMSAEQIDMLQRRYLDTALLERANLPRLSLFYLH